MGQEAASMGRRFFEEDTLGCVSSQRGHNKCRAKARRWTHCGRSHQCRREWKKRTKGPTTPHRAFPCPPEGLSGFQSTDSPNSFGVVEETGSRTESKSVLLLLGGTAWVLCARWPSSVFSVGGDTRSRSVWMVYGVGLLRGGEVSVRLLPFVGYRQLQQQLTPQQASSKTICLALSCLAPQHTHAGYS